MTEPLDLLLVFDANERMGFGHAARCVGIAERALCERPALRLAVLGELSPQARDRVRARLPAAALLDPGESASAHVAVVDRLADTEEPEAFDVPLAEQLARRGSRVVALLSGSRAPDFGPDVVAIGYQPGGPPAQPPRLLWGLGYAPVAARLGPAAAFAPQRGRVLVALGGAPDDRCLRTVIGAVTGLEDVEAIDVLRSPAMPVDVASISALDARIAVHEKIPSVAPLLVRSEIVVASYGHLMWEALALGCATCLLGQKRFQTEWGERLARTGCVVHGGDGLAVDLDALRDALRRTRLHAAELRAKARSLLDGRGLERITALVLQLLEQARAR